jgi:hypothetical protein
VGIIAENVTGAPPPLLDHSIFPKAWGAVAADEILKEIEFPRELPGCVLDELILLWADRYAALVDTDLPGLGDIDDLLLGSSDFSDPAVSGRLAGVRSSLRKQHKALLGRDWALFEEHASRSELELMAEGERRLPVPPSTVSTDRAVKLIEHSPGIAASDIAKQLRIKPNYLCRILGDLEKIGRVKKGSPDVSVGHVSTWSYTQMLWMGLRTKAAYLPG